MTEYDGANRSNAGWNETLAAYAQLVRVPNLFTAPPDIVLGGAIVAGLGHAVSLPALVGLSIASMLLYAAGTTLNDYFDAEEDARERPERPIPSGIVSPTQALAFGVTLLAGGVLLALVVAGPVAGAVAATIAALVVLYDGAFKGSAIGFLFMGGSRGVNVLLGTTVAVAPPALAETWWALAAPFVITLYIAGVTYMAESESGESDPTSVTVAIAGTAIAAVGALGVLVVREPSAVDAVVAAAFLVAFVVWVGRALWRARADPVPGTIGPTIGVCILGLAVLNAAFAGTTGVEWALATAAFLVPAVAFATFFDVS